MDPPSPLSSRIEPAETPSVGQLLNVVLAAVVVGTLYLARQFLVPITLAILLAFVLAPLVRVLRRWRLPQVPAVLVTVALSLAALCGVGALIGSQLAALGHELPNYQQTIQGKIQDVGGLTTGKLAAITGRLGLQAQQAGRQAAKAAGLARGPQKPATTPTLVEVYRPPATTLDFARQLLRPILAPLATVGLVFVLTVFMLMQQSDLRDRLIRLMGSGDLHRTTLAMNDAAARLSRYFLSQLCVNIGFGVAIGAALTLIGVPHSVLWGAVASLMRFIPYLGGLISSGLAAAMAAAVDPGWAMVAWTVGLFLLVEVVTGQFVEPLFYGHSTGLSPVSIVVAAVFWTWLWGPVGLILSTPLSLCLVVLGRHVPRLAFIEVLLGDRPPLTPVESFYQRVLASDADDVLQQAETVVAASNLSTYYDDVAMKGLLLAASDAQRGILKRDQLVGFKSVVEALISDLAEAADADSEGQARSAEWAKAVELGGRGGRILCVSGPGLLDDLGCDMLCQLLHKHGVENTSTPYRSASREQIQSLDLTKVALVCVLHLSVGRNQSRLRNLLARLRTRTSAPLVLALMRGEEGSEWEKQQTLPVVTTLSEAIDVCGKALIDASSTRAVRPRKATRKA